MNNLLGMTLQIRDEQRSFWRNPPAAAFTFGFTVMFLVLFSAIFGNQKLSLHGLKFIDYFVPSIITLGIISSCYTSVAMLVVTRAKNGAFKRLKLTPLPNFVYVGGIIGSSLITGFILTVVTMVFGMVFYHLGLPNNMWIFLLSILVGSITFCLLGILVATLIPNLEAAPPIINGIILPLYFISGTFYMVPSNTLVAKIAECFPVRPFIMTTFYSYQSTKYVPTNFNSGGFLVLCIWAVFTAILTVRRMKYLGTKKH